MSAAKSQLAAYVFVDNEWFGPDSDVPADAAKQITNPKAWEGGNAPDAEPDGPAYPDGEPSEDWTGKQLDAYAADKTVDLAGASTKAEKVAAIQAAASA